MKKSALLIILPALLLPACESLTTSALTFSIGFKGVSATITVPPKPPALPTTPDGKSPALFAEPIPNNQ